MAIQARSALAKPEPFPPRPEIAADCERASLGLVLGADSLATSRSGIGRVTLELFRILREHPEIRVMRLLMAGRPCDPAGWEHLLADPVGGPPIPAAAPARSGPGMARLLRSQLRRIPAARRLHEARLRRHSQRDLREMYAQADGRVLYYEPNFIAQPFDGLTVVEVNDLSWHYLPEFHPAERIDWIARNLDRTLKQASRFVSISEFTAGALHEAFGIPRDRIDVVPLAPSASFRPISREAAASILSKHRLQDRAYIFTVSTLEPRKNFDRLLAAHRLLPLPLRIHFPLAIAGGSGWGRVFESPAAEAARREGSLRLLGYVPDSDLPALLGRAALCPYVSVYEGFGLPVLEAMAAGTPVVASSTTAVGETAEAAALLVDPMDERAIAHAMRELLESEERADQYRMLGHAHAARFSWERTVAEMIASWRKALA